MKLTRARTLAATVAVAALALTGCATSTQSSGSTSGSHHGKVTLTFQSLAFQDPTIKATKAIVAAWNQAHPDVQVKYVQGSWDSVQDQLVTQFQGGTAPDIIQYESAEMSQFAQQGYLADLTPYLSSDLKKAVSSSIWKTVTVNGKIIAAPTLLQSYMVFANLGLLQKAGVTVPTGSSWSWNDFQAAAKATTSNGVYGVGWGLDQPTATMMSMGQEFGATYFKGSGKDASIDIGNDEMALPERIHQMAYDDKSIDPTSLTQDGSDVMTGFLKGKYAMTVQGSYIAQTLSQQAPASLKWAVLPPLSGTSVDQNANPQTLSVSAQSKDVKDSAAFIDFYEQAQNLSKVAEGDWLIPASSTAASDVAKDTGGKDGWSTILASGKDLVDAPFQFATDYPQWKDQIATPAYQQYLSNQISSSDLASKLTSGWSSVNQ